MAEKVVFAPTRLQAAAVGILGMTTIGAFAQTIPVTGGEALRNIERSVPAAPINSANGAKIEIPEAPAMGAHQNNARVHVNGYRITGNTVFDAGTLLPLIAARTGDLSLGELQKIADTVAAYYRDRGYLLTLAYIPEQEIEQGTITIAVLEGRYDRIGVDNHARLGQERAQRILAQAICKADDCAGALIQRQPLERGLLLLNDTPGAHAAAQLAPGQRIGTSRLDVDVEGEPLATGSVQLDNLGGYYSGSTRAIVPSTTCNRNGQRLPQLTLHELHTNVPTESVNAPSPAYAVEANPNLTAAPAATAPAPATAPHFSTLRRGTGPMVAKTLLSVDIRKFPSLPPC